MGENWVTVRRSAHDGTLRPGNPAAREVAERWEQFASYLALSLSQELGASVVAHRPRTQSMTTRIEETAKSLGETGRMHSTLRIPDAVGALEIHADLRSRQTTTSVAIDAPREGKQRARFNWIIKQLLDAPDDLRVEAAFPNARVTTAASLGSIREDPTVLYYPPDPRREPRAFVLARSRPMGQKKGRVEGSFVRETSAQAVEFYRDLLQHLKPWTAPAPKLRSESSSAETTSTELAIVPAWVGDSLSADHSDGSSMAPPPPDPIVTG
jgi:hypothetical protein